MEKSPCCCSCSLKTGTNLIGLYQMMGGLLNIAFCVFGNLFRDQITLLTVKGTISAFESLFAIILLVGALKEIASYLKIWVVSELISIIIMFTLYAFLISLHPIESIGIIPLIYFILSESLSLYFIDVVRRYRLELLKKSTSDYNSDHNSIRLNNLQIPSSQDYT